MCMNYTDKNMEQTFYAEETTEVEVHMFLKWVVF